MTNELTPKNDQPIDGFDGYEDATEGSDQSSSGSVIAGTTRLKFTNQATWETASDEAMTADLELVAVDLLRIVQKWVDQRPIETRILEPGEKFPNVEELNKAAPKSEWREGPNGQPQGPWQAQYILFLLNPATMERYSFPTATVGGGIAIRELRDKTKWMRRFRGQGAYPVVTLSDTFMKTRFGGRQRPNFLVKRWVNLGEAETAPALPNSPGPKLAPGRELKEPSLAEEMKDAIDF